MRDDADEAAYAQVSGAYKGISERLRLLEKHQAAKRHRGSIGSCPDEATEDDDDDAIVSISNSPKMLLFPPTQAPRFRTDVSTMTSELPTYVAAVGTRPLLRVRAPTDFGQVVKCVGGIKDLGLWKAAQGMVMATSSKDYPEWTGRPVGTLEEGVYEFKYIKVGEFGDTVWESGPNRRLVVTVDGLPPAGVKEIVSLEDPDEELFPPLLLGTPEPEKQNSALGARWGGGGVDTEREVVEGGMDGEREGDGGAWVAIRDSMVSFEDRLKKLMKDVSVRVEMDLPAVDSAAQPVFSEDLLKGSQWDAKYDDDVDADWHWPANATAPADTPEEAKDEEEEEEGDEVLECDASMLAILPAPVKVDLPGAGALLMRAISEFEATELEVDTSTSNSEPSTLNPPTLSTESQIPNPKPLTLNPETRRRCWRGQRMPNAPSSRPEAQALDPNPPTSTPKPRWRCWSGPRLPRCLPPEKRQSKRLRASCVPCELRKL